MRSSITESREFHVWLKRHDNHLRAYAPDEIARLALLCGFEISTVCSGVNDQLAFIRRLMRFWESPFSGKWMRIVKYESGLDA